jgi:hypothetical protein
MSMPHGTREKGGLTGAAVRYLECRSACGERQRDSVDDDAGRQRPWSRPESLTPGRLEAT